MEDIYYYKDEKGFELSEAVKRAIKRNGSILDEVLDEDTDDDLRDTESQSEVDDEDMDIETWTKRLKSMLCSLTFTQCFN